MTLLVTGAGGHLGRLIVHALLERGADPGQVVATARDLTAVADLAALGVQTRMADYGDPASLDRAFAGADRIVLVSSNAMGQRVAQHAAVIDAAARAGVRLLAYTSVANADTSTLDLAVEHLETERLLAASGLPTVLLRNGWYLENYTESLAPVLDSGVLLGAAGEGRVSAASRRDYAEAAAAVLLAEEPAGRVYELGGDTSFTMAEYAATVSAVTGRPIRYTDLQPEQYAGALAEAGVPDQFADLLADSDRGLARGDLYVDSTELTRLIGRPTTTVEQAVRSALD